MDQIVHRILRFDRFSLDLARGCLRLADQDIELRPKSFDVLCYLANNAGRLVSKRELYDAVWPNTAVTDGSLVQCIRELRDKLGDDERRLIKTVHRRGYLLDTTVTETTPQQLLAGAAAAEPSLSATEAAASEGSSSAVQERRQGAWSGRGWAAAAAAFVVAALASIDWMVGPAISVGSHSAGPVVPASSAQSPRIFKDCDDCPEMVALPAGAFMMGSPEDDVGRREVEGLPRRVVIAKEIAVGRLEVTVDQFARFIADTGTPENNSCLVVVGFDNLASMRRQREASFRRQPGYDVTGSHPASCVNRHDAQAYVAWLQRRTGKPYRLPTEAEWEYAARAGTTTNFSFGNDGSSLCAYARFADLNSPFSWRSDCRSEAVTVGPLQTGRLKPNPWGLHDVHGNVFEWVEDCWTADPSAIPTDGTALVQPDNCEMGVIRGGSWVTRSLRVRSAFRLGVPAIRRNQNVGFRVALTLDP